MSQEPETTQYTPEQGFYMFNHFGQQASLQCAHLADWIEQAESDAPNVNEVRDQFKVVEQAYLDAGRELEKCMKMMAECATGRNEGAQDGV